MNLAQLIIPFALVFATITVFTQAVASWRSARRLRVRAFEAACSVVALVGLGFLLLETYFFFLVVE